MNGAIAASLPAMEAADASPAAETVRHPAEMLIHWAQTVPDRPWLHQPVGGRVHTYTWSRAAALARRMAAALQAQNWPRQSCVALCGINTAHWYITDLAIQMAGHVPVGLYPKQSERMTRYILEHCEAKAIILGPTPDATEFLKGVPDGVLKIALPYPDTPPGDIGWDAFCEGHEPLREYRRAASDDLMTIIYTSGTTGDPKGVMMTYGNLEFVAGEMLTEVFRPGPNERLFSYLPLAHLLERAAGLGGSLYWCAEVFFIETLDREKILAALRTAAPTRFVAIPLIWTRFHSTLASKMPERWLRRLTAAPVLGRWLRHRLLSLLGLQNLRAAFSGAAPLPKSTIEFFRDVFGIEIIEAYGQTENSAYCSVGLPGASRPGSVGRPLPSANFRLGPDGEIQVKHAGVMKGYYKDPERTRAFTEDGWLRSGDKGYLDDDGFLYITGRIKDIFKTQKGKYVAPVPIENAMARNTDIDQLCLVGAGLTQPIMLLTLTDAARAKPADAVERQLIDSMNAVNAALEDHERIAKLIVLPDTWTIDNGMLTPTMKVKRSMIEECYGLIIRSEAQDRSTVVVWI